MVDQALGLGVDGVIGTRFQRRTQLVRVLLAIGRRSAHSALIDRGHPGGLGQPVGGSIIVVEVGVDGVLVFFALFEIGGDAVLVKEALEKDIRHRHAGDLERRPRLHPELVGGRAQHVGRSDGAGGIEALTMGDDRPAGFAEMLERLAQFVGFARLHAALGQAHEQRLDPAVALGPMQGLDNCHHRQLAAAEAREGALRLLVDQVAPQVQRQDRLGRGCGRVRSACDQADDQERHADEKQHQPGEDTGHGQQELFHQGSRADWRRR